MTPAEYEMMKRRQAQLQMQAQEAAARRVTTGNRPDMNVIASAMDKAAAMQAAREPINAIPMGNAPLAVEPKFPVSQPGVSIPTTGGIVNPWGRGEPRGLCYSQMQKDKQAAIDAELKKALASPEPFGA